MMALKGRPAGYLNSLFPHLFVICLATSLLILTAQAAPFGRRLLVSPPALPFSIDFQGVPSNPTVPVGFQTTITVVLTNIANQTGNPGDGFFVGVGWFVKDPTPQVQAWHITDPKSTDPALTVELNPPYGVIPTYRGALTPGGSVKFTFVLTAVQADAPGDKLILDGNTFVGPPAAAPLPIVVAAQDQGMCGSGAAQYFPNRCYFNNDPLGRYVCCDSQGCDGFNPPAFVFPHCKNAGFIPAGYGVGAPATTTLVPASTACPAVDGVSTNSCFNQAGTAHVCCVNPDSCGAFAPNGDPTCASGQYFVFS